MKVFMAILSALCLGAMLTEKEGSSKLMWFASFITTIIAILIMMSTQVM